MKISANALKVILDESKENKVIDNLFGHYFKGEIIPAVITEKQIVFYTPGESQFYISEYSMANNSLNIEGMKKLSFGKEDVPAEQSKDSIFESLFELDEARGSFKKSLKEIKKSISENKVLISEDVFVDRMKEMAKGKAVNILHNIKTGVGSGYSVENNNTNTALKSIEDGQPNIDGSTAKVKSIINKTGGKATPENQNAGSIEPGRTPQMSDELWRGIIKATGPTVDAFYNSFDVTKVKFNWSDGKGLYKDIKIDFPKNKMWIAENKEELEKLPEGQYQKDIKEYSSVVEDTVKMLKTKKYVEDEMKDPALMERASLLTGVLEKSKDAKKGGLGFWRNKFFKQDLKEMYENKMDVENFVSTYGMLHLLTDKELNTVMEKALINSIEKANVLTESPKIVKVIQHIMDEQGTRKAFFKEILGEEIENTKQLVDDLAVIAESIHDSTIGTADDETMHFIEKLMGTLEDLMSKYHEKTFDVKDQQGMADISKRLNEILARGHVIDDDRDFLKSVATKMNDLQSSDEDAAKEISNDKEDRIEGYEKIEGDILNKNAEGTGKNSVEDQKPEEMN